MTDDPRLRSAPGIRLSVNNSRRTAERAGCFGGLPPSSRRVAAGLRGGYRCANELLTNIGGYVSARPRSIALIGSIFAVLGCSSVDSNNHAGDAAIGGTPSNNGGSSDRSSSATKPKGGSGGTSQSVRPGGGGNKSTSDETSEGGAAGDSGDDDSTLGGSSTGGRKASGTSAGGSSSKVGVGGEDSGNGGNTSSASSSTKNRQLGGSSAKGGASSSTAEVSTGGSGKTSSSTATGGMVATGGATTSTPSAVKVCAASGTLKQAAACNDKLIGAAVSQSGLGNSGYANAAGEFNFFTAENEMKWQNIESSQGSFNYGPGDAIVNFASQRGAKVKGHTLVWHSQLAGWVNSASDVKGAMINHITSVMNHYKGKIYSWDVVNEAVDVDNIKTGMGNAKLRASVFYNKIGKDYIDLAFQTARDVDPSTKLFYNDFSSEGMNDKSDFIYEMVKSMKDRGIPIDGVGMQTHIGAPNTTPTIAAIKENIKRLAALGLEIHMSELDINGCDGINDATMATMYHDIVAACVEEPKCTAITVWGINDGASWLNSWNGTGCNGQSSRSLLFNDSYQKKGTYTAVLNALTGN